MSRVFFVLGCGFYLLTVALIKNTPLFTSRNCTQGVWVGQEMVLTKAIGVHTCLKLENTEPGLYRLEKIWAFHDPGKAHK